MNKDWPTLIRQHDKLTVLGGYVMSHRACLARDFLLALLRGHCEGLVETAVGVAYELADTFITQAEKNGDLCEIPPDMIPTPEAVRNDPYAVVVWSDERGGYERIKGWCDPIAEEAKARLQEKIAGRDA